jgi:DNA-directed RNA polymerase I, II, and III subunit RPABC1
MPIKINKKEEAGFDIFKNKLVPKARILKEEEKEALLKKYDIILTQLPRISVADSVSKVLKAKAGDIIEFTRKTKTAGLSKYYRVIIGGGA